MSASLFTCFRFVAGRPPLAFLAIPLHLLSLFFIFLSPRSSSFTSLSFPFLLFYLPFLFFFFSFLSFFSWFVLCFFFVVSVYRHLFFVNKQFFPNTKETTTTRFLVNISIFSKLFSWGWGWNRGSLPKAKHLARRLLVFRVTWKGGAGCG
mgnify:CR=1 FL=1